MKEIKGSLAGQNKKIGIVISRFNEAISKNLLNGAIDCLIRHGVSSDDI
ncbi:MAG TPA: 6,7-dimethyl-8-ribityllumazine synthase, partial [Candidatus Goldiibacteriota bacterium]|nr:6,7-dimethyl-8-ribityllumazine synthase [Candidatus Goldiibacteriota bacterium]